MTREQKINLLVARLQDESRRLDLDRIDEQARATNTWGSQGHRQSREQRERSYYASRAAYTGLSDDALDKALAASEPA
jgi:hypothetical protein